MLILSNTKLILIAYHGFKSAALGRMRVSSFIYLWVCLLETWLCCGGHVSNMPNSEKYVIIIVFKVAICLLFHSSEGYGTFLLLDRQVKAE